MNLQTSRPGLCYPARLISLIALNILVLIMNAIAANDFSTIASSQQQLQIISFTPNFFPSSTQASTAACSRQEVFQIAHGAGNDTYALLMGNNRNRISLVDTNFFTFKNLLQTMIGPLQNNFTHAGHPALRQSSKMSSGTVLLRFPHDTIDESVPACKLFPFADDESMSASTSWIRDVSSLSITCENCLSSKREEEYYFLIASNELGLTTTSSSYASAYYSSADHGSGISTKIKKGWFMHAYNTLHQRSYFLSKSTMWHPSTNISLQMLSWTPFSPQNIELGTNVSPRNVELGTNVIPQNIELDTNVSPAKVELDTIFSPADNVYDLTALYATGFSYAYANTLHPQLLSPGLPYWSCSYHYVFSLLTPNIISHRTLKSYDVHGGNVTDNHVPKRVSIMIQPPST